MEPEELFIKRFSELINSKNYTLEEIGHAIGIKSKSTISKYLSGNIKNIKRSHIVKIANLFNVSPSWLAGFSNNKYQNGSENIDLISKNSSKDTIRLLDYYNQLNTSGKEKAIENIKDLTKISDYTCPEKETKQIKNA